MIRYQPNNIIFRIASSDAISKFKALQANSFLQVARKDLKFESSPREMVLLEYDRFSQWLFRIERICVAAQEGMMEPSLANTIKESCMEELRTIEIVLDSYPAVFNPTLSYFLKIIHSYSVPIFEEKMGESIKQTVDRAFRAVVNIISDYLQHSLMCMHEINNNFITHLSNPFLSISDFCAKNLNDRFFPMRKRAEYFSSIGCGTTFILKNYSDQDIFTEAAHYAENFGITLTPE